MHDILVGILALAIGAVFCFRGYVLMRVVIPVWGAFAGFILGAGLVAATSDESFLRSLLAWAVGVAVAMVFGLLAYLYYEVSVTIAMGAIGFTLGTGLMVALGVSWSWLIVVGGVAVAIALALLAIVADLPGVLLIVLSALAGAIAITGGLMLLTDVVDTADFTVAATTERISDEWWWYLIYLAVAITGIVAQVRETRHPTAPMRESWVNAGGHELRRS